MSAVLVDPEPEEPSDDAPAQNKSGLTASEQGSNVPLGWKPTRSAPVPVVRCVTIKKDGNRCERWSLRGIDLCYAHSGRGNLKNVHERQAAVIESSRLRLIEDTDLAVDVLERLTQPGTAEGIMLKAAESILDRAGLRGGFELDVVVEERDSPVEELRKRLLELKKGADARDRMLSGEYDDDVVEGEVLSEQPALFEMEEEDDGSTTE